ncbi:recombinase family protein [Nocardia sp. NPDC052112]|uniref:recombinase family protein n=1 Tax=Nocardia sp. NPDC052112 TaxID=3155646 RepID=UPI00341F466F
MVVMPSNITKPPLEGRVKSGRRGTSKLKDASPPSSHGARNIDKHCVSHPTGRTGYRYLRHVAGQYNPYTVHGPSSAGFRATDMELPLLHRGGMAGAFPYFVDAIADRNGVQFDLFEPVWRPEGRHRPADTIQFRWQRGNAEKFVSEASIVADYFDIGQSRSVPWHRRREAARLLADLKNPARGWTAIVVGEGTRCWFGNQFSLVAPRLQAHGVQVWVPELGGRFDSRNVTHSMMMSMLGGLSESERQHVQQRTRASMDAQVLNEGRHQGGRAPYGYVVVDGPAHPNPNRASDGLKLRILSLDVSTAPVVQRIFRDYIAGRGDRAIAIALNRDGVPCPSAHRPEQNRHRAQDGWQAPTIAAILQNPRYTGYAVFGRWTKHENSSIPTTLPPVTSSGSGARPPTASFGRRNPRIRPSSRSKPSPRLNCCGESAPASATALARNSNATDQPAVCARTC